MIALDKHIKLIDKNGKVLAELSKILKDVTVEEFKKLLSNLTPFGKYTNQIFHREDAFKSRHH